ncbi:MAG: hypothetical protein DCC49_11360 [Acidobacteria bacterium]|nr:MAG: hypothetical protein DCC49_11360 [Acidobacteriota bacterium]
MDEQRTGAYARTSVEEAPLPVGFGEPNRPTGLIATVIALSILLVASLAGNIVLLQRKPETVTVPGPIVAVTVTPTASPSISPTASPSLTPTATPSTGPTPTGPATRPEDAAERLYSARKAGSKTSAKTVATQKAIDQVFAKSGSNYSFDGCETDTSANPQKSTCKFTKSGSTMTMELTMESGKWTVQSVKYS